MLFDPGYKNIKNVRGGVKWYMLETKDLSSSINFSFENEKDELVSFNGQSMIFQLSIKEGNFFRWQRRYQNHDYFLTK